MEPIPYERFRTGLDFASVQAMLWRETDDRSQWRCRSRNAVLGYWRQLKRAMYDDYLATFQGRRYACASTCFCERCCAPAAAPIVTDAALAMAVRITLGLPAPAAEAERRPAARAPRTPAILGLPRASEGRALAWGGVVFGARGPPPCRGSPGLLRSALPADRWSSVLSFFDRSAAHLPVGNHAPCRRGHADPTHRGLSRSGYLFPAEFSRTRTCVLLAS